MTTWAQAWGESDRTCGADLPRLTSLPLYSSRVDEVRAGATGQGIVARIQATARRIFTARHDNAAEVKKLQKLIAEIAE